MPSRRWITTCPGGKLRSVLAQKLSSSYTPTRCQLCQLAYANPPQPCTTSRREKLNPEGEPRKVRSVHKGVCWDINRKKWRAEICVEGKQVRMPEAHACCGCRPTHVSNCLRYCAIQRHLGYFDETNELGAAARYTEAAAKVNAGVTDLAGVHISSTVCFHIIGNLETMHD